MNSPMPAPEPVCRLREMLASRHTVRPFLMRLFLAVPIVFLGGLDCLVIPRLKGLFSSLDPSVSGFPRFVLSFDPGFQAVALPVALAAVFAAIWILFRGKGPKAYTILSSLLLLLTTETALLAYFVAHAGFVESSAIRM